MHRQRKQTGARARRHDLECRIVAGVGDEAAWVENWAIGRCRDKFLAEVENPEFATGEERRLI